MKVFVSLLIAVGCLLAVPVTAAAALYTVDSVGDQEDETKGANGCKTSVNTCTLRAAIEEANFDSAADTIKFNPSFNGQVADTIELGSSLPAIEFPLTIDGDAEGVGGQCATEAGEKGPCAGINGPVGGAALIVEDADKVSIEGLALTGALGGGSGVITVIESSKEFKAVNNWLGIKLDGASAGNTKGIYLDPGSDKAVIGGVNAAERNVFANSGFEALDIEGASDADMQGNYFGVKPMASRQRSIRKNIEISNTLAFEATGNEVGANDRRCGARYPGMRRRLQRGRRQRARQYHGHRPGRKWRTFQRGAGHWPDHGSAATTSGLVPTARLLLANGDLRRSRRRCRTRDDWRSRSG